MDEYMKFLIFNENQQKNPLQICHLFNKPYYQITEDLLKNLNNLGFSHIQLSPVNHSDETG